MTAYLCEVLETNRRILTHKQRGQLAEEVAFVSQADTEMWGHLKNKKVLMRGCKTFMLELFCGAMILTSAAQSHGWLTSQPADILLDGANLLDRQWRETVEEQIDRDDPFCLVIPFPCGPWNSWTRFNAQRFPHIGVRVEAEQREHKPMLEWIVKISKPGVEKGRLVLLENGLTSSALDLSVSNRSKD